MFYIELNRVIVRNYNLLNMGFLDQKRLYVKLYRLYIYIGHGLTLLL